jgi:threonylcarbamoyladenosine tRNA methylthiotransferase MtaB
MVETAADTIKMPTFKIITLGCKVNQAESDTIHQDLKSSGWRAAAGEVPPDVCIINTCTVTGKASMQSRQILRQAIRENPDARIVVTGCYAQTAAEELAAIDGVSDIVGNTYKQKISSMLTAGDDDTSKRPRTLCGSATSRPPFDWPPATGSIGRTRAFLKIQDGCNAICAYCIVPHARGPSRSMPFYQVVENLKALAENGYREAVLTGIHLGHYGLDLHPPSSLKRLLETVVASRPIQRVRLSSIEPLEISPDIIELAADHPMVCRHFHIPLQSGDDRVLAKMKRPYRVDYFRSLVGRIHRKMPDAAIGLDVMAGFPGETDSAFAETADLIRELPVSYLHVFPFSPRPGTPAKALPEQVPGDVAKQRCRHIRAIGDAKRREFRRKFVGSIVQVLVETKRDPKTRRLKGITSNYLPVFFNGEDRLMNRLISVRIEEMEGDRLLGTVQQHSQFQHQDKETVFHDPKN